MALTNDRLISALSNWNALYWHVKEIDYFSNLRCMVEQQTLNVKSCAGFILKGTQYGLTCYK